MKEKNLIILCVIFAVLVGLIFFKKSMKPHVPTTEDITDIIKPPVNKDTITGILLRLGDGSGSDKDKPNENTVHLVKEEDQWTVQTQYGVTANDKVITPLLEKLDQLTGELRSDKADILSDYGITDEQAVHVELFRREGEPLHVIVGTRKAGYQNNFVRLKGSNAVYVINENLLATLGLRGEGEGQKLDTHKWADKRIIHLAVNDVAGITITETDGETEKKVIDAKRELVDGQKQWQSAIPYAFHLSASKIKNMMKAFNNTYAKEIIAPDVEGVFDAPGWTGTFTMDNGGQVSLIRGAKDKAGTNYYMKLEGADYFYLVPVSTFHSRKDQQGNIFASNPFKVEESNLEAIDIHVISSNKKFRVVKKAQAESDKAVTEEETGDKSAKKEDLWVTPDGESMDQAKIKDIINKIKAVSLEMVLRPSTSVKDSMVMRITKEGVTTKYTVSNDLILETGKECRFLRVDSEDQSYCVSKPPIVALQNALP